MTAMRKTVKSVDGHPPYLFRAQWSGAIRWTCIRCAHVNPAEQMRPGDLPRVVCGNCRKVYMIGSVCWEVPPGGRAPRGPKDLAIPNWEDPMPEGLIMERAWRAGNRVHVIVGDFYGGETEAETED